MVTQKQHFENVLRVAQWLSDGENPVNSLLALARLVGREFAYEIMLDELAPKRADGLTPVVGWRRMANAYGIRVQPGRGERVWLEWDPVVAQPWNGGRLADALEKLSRGPSDQYQAWRLDPTNHSIILWLPMRLAEVAGGNHSITAGMLSNTGEIPASGIFDLSPLYARLSQPVAWRDNDRSGVTWVKDGGFMPITVEDWRLGLLFEVGRLLHQHGFDGRFGDRWQP
jgi:hypothetical protein